jgi:transposase
MLTGMIEDDWSIVLEVFDAAQSRRGEPGHDDRKFLEAVHFFTVHNITWRALPAEYGNWNSIWKRFWRLSRSGVFEAFFQLLAETSKTAHLVQMFDSTVVRAHVSAAGAKGGQQNQALGRSRGGFSCKIHLKTDFHGLPIAFHLTGGEANDCIQLEISLDIGPDITPRAALTDKGYDSAANRAACRQRRIIPVIPHRSNAKDKPRFFPKMLYRTRAHRADRRQAETLQAHRLAMREDRRKLRCPRGICLRSHLG